MYREETFLLLPIFHTVSIFIPKGVAYVFLKVIYVYLRSSLPLTYPMSRFQSENKGEILPSRELFFNRCFGVSALQIPF